MSKAEPHRPGAAEPKLSRATAARMSLYLRRLERLESEGIETISSSQLGQALDLSDAQVRKDLAYLGHLGYPGIGYHPKELCGVIRRVLGVDRSWAVILVGVGNLARALLRYRGFERQGFNIVGVFDSDADKIGQRFEELEILPMQRLAQVVAERDAQLGIITVPATSAQGVADILVAAGIRGILNFAPAVVKLPPGVAGVSIDLAIQMEQLAFLVQNRIEGQMVGGVVSGEASMVRCP
jgi:redox-sensing transcriptional repressor